MKRTRSDELDQGRQHPDAGFGLMEVVVSIALVGTIVMAGLAATWSTIRVSDQHRNSVVTDTLLRSSAESILSSTTNYVDCATTGSYTSELASDPTGIVIVTITDVAYWDGSSPPMFTASCGSDAGVTAIELTATSTRDNSTVELVILKRSSQ